MDKIRGLITMLLGLLGLVALAVGLSWLFGPQGPRPGQQVLPTQQVSPLRTPTPRRYVEPTAPSEDWPTLTPPPTRVMPTPGPTAVKPTPLPTPTPTPLPSLPLPPIPEGETPDDLWSILYLPLEDELAVHGVLVDARGRRWSDPKVVYDFRKVAPGPHTCLTRLDVAPTGEWLAVAIAYLESNQTWLLNLASQEPHLTSACKEYRACIVRDWSLDGRVMILQLSRRYQSSIDRPDEFVIVDVASDATAHVQVPDPTFDHFSVRQVAFSPDGRSIAWIIRNRGREEMTEVWLTDSKGGQAQLLASEAGRIWNFVWHPDGSQAAYSFASGNQGSNILLILVGEHKVVPLVPSLDSLSNPAWSPDGLQVAMTQCANVPAGSSLADQECNISVLDRRNDLISPIVTSPGRAYWDLSWSPDGGLLAFLSANERDLQTVWLSSPGAGSSYPISEYLRPFSEYIWLPNSFADEQ